MIDTVQALLRTRLADDSVALAHGDRSWTWREHLAEAAAEASALIGLADPDRPVHVGALLTNSPAYARAMAAAALGGYVLCGINTTRRGDGLGSDIVRSDCQLLLVDSDHAPLLDGLDLPGVTVLDVDGPGYARAVAAATPLTPHREVTGTDPFMMIFTSGTSGNPKAVPFAHAMSVMCGLSLAAQLDITAADVCYLSMPLFHSNGVAAGWSVAIAAGATMVPVKFSVSRFLTDIRRYGATFANYVGKPLALVLSTPERPDDADNPLRVMYGNEAADRDIAEFSRRFDCRIVDGFGSSEFAVVVVREDGTPPGSIGKGWPGVAVYHPDTVTECAVGGIRRPRRPAQLRRCRRRAGEHRRGGPVLGLLQRPRRHLRSGCGTACTGPGTWPTATPTAGSTWPGAPRTGCASTGRTWPPRRSSGSCSGCPDQSGRGLRGARRAGRRSGDGGGRAAGETAR